MRVMLTGNLGYLGAVMTPVLRDAGHEVTGLDTGYFASCVHGPVPDDPPVTLVDIRDVSPDQLRGFDAVVHLAALSNDPLGNLAPHLTHEINYEASVRLARLARDAGVRRFLYSSSCSVYGASGDAPVDETAPLAPLTPYAVSKIAVEAELTSLADDDFVPVYLRNATAFGWSPRLRGDLVLNNLVAHAVLSGEVLVLSDGTPWRPLVHAQDIARAFVAALEAPADAVNAEAFNVGSDEQNLTVAEIAHVVAEVVPGSRVVITGETGADARSYRVDFGKLKRTFPSLEFGWTPHAGAADLLARFESYGLTPDDLSDRFTRLRHLEVLRRVDEVDDELRWRALAEPVTR